ncbi:MAG TPA: hypothetical protein VIA06_07290 [Candidatus Dormibacteraeota bacterium]|jgi:hypothetical protein|nr:hypothetical protein [Candidatus Dormibacteraeota bacterium]
MDWHSDYTTAQERYERLIADVAAARATRRRRPQQRTTLGGRLANNFGDALIQLGERIRSDQETIETTEEDDEAERVA